jgi:hypothetical protein
MNTVNIKNTVNINNEYFSDCTFWSDRAMSRIFSVDKAAKKLALLKLDVVKNHINFRTDSESQAKWGFWNAIPTVDAQAKRNDVVKDFSIDSCDGHVGVVTDVREVKKRDGRIGVVVEMKFFAHTNLDTIRTRKLQFVKVVA